MSSPLRLNDLFTLVVGHARQGDADALAVIFQVERFRLLVDHDFLLRHVVWLFQASVLGVVSVA